MGPVSPLLGFYSICSYSIHAQPLNGHPSKCSPWPKLFLFMKSSWLKLQVVEVISLQTATIFGQKENPTFVVSNKQKSLQNHLSLQKLVTICEQNHILILDPAFNKFAKNIIWSWQLCGYCAFYHYFNEAKLQQCTRYNCAVTCIWFFSLQGSHWHHQVQGVQQRKETCLLRSREGNYLFLNKTIIMEIVL